MGVRLYAAWKYLVASHLNTKSNGSSPLKHTSFIQLPLFELFLLKSRIPCGDGGRIQFTIWYLFVFGTRGDENFKFRSLIFSLAGY